MVTPTKGTEHYVSRSDGRVYYYKTGRGEPLVFLHGTGSSGWSWKNVTDKFSEHFTCYIIDSPGFDHSDIPPRKYSPDDYTMAIFDVIDSVGIKKTNMVAAHTGAMVAVNMAVTYPERVNKLVLDGLPYWNVERGQAFFETRIKPRFKDVTSYDIPVDPLLTWEEAVKSNPNMNRELFEKREDIKRKSRHWSRLSLEAFTSFDIEAVAPRVKAATLIINGDGDRNFDEEGAKKGIKGSIHRVISQSPGQSHEYQPEEFVKIALPFLLDS